MITLQRSVFSMTIGWVVFFLLAFGVYSGAVFLIQQVYSFGWFIVYQPFLVATK